jgi:UDP-N-acetylmuramoyl-L-alanyl-D-glutamate--2,6-diaminopimelate ligase
MRLGALVDDPATVADRGLLDREVTGLTADSRRVRPGFVFAALPGRKTDGARFAAEAVAAGAVAVLGGPDLPAGLPAIRDPEPRRRLALMAARFSGRQPALAVAVTGTSGKTSTVAFCQQIWAALGEKAASLGTLGIRGPGVDRGGSLTTPDPVALHDDLAALADAGIGRVALEASSHGLDQFRLDGVRFAAGGFTNLAHEHLDYHGTMAAYRAAKRRLFSEVLPKGAAAVVNADDDAAADFAAAARARGLSVLAYGRTAGADGIALVEAAPHPDRLAVSFRFRGTLRRAAPAVAGGFQAWNMLCAYGLVVATGGDAERAAAALGGLRAPPGRLELVATTDAGAAVYVDYAHKPEALATILEALRAHTAGRLFVVFGCGGDRDRAKRPMMGAIARRLADRAIVTDDNPRTESAAAIRAEIRAGAPGLAEIGDRAAAIHEAVRTLAAGDVLVIAGKGHETGQIVGDRTLPFDDAEVARAAVAAERPAA